MVFLSLLFLWILFNGRLTAEVLLIGLIISLLLYLFVRKHVAPRLRPGMEAFVLRRVPKMLAYAAFLIREIFHAALATLRFILSDREEVVPRMVTFNADLETDAARVALANSITLTPGTITVLLSGNRFTVHCLDESFAQGLLNSGFEQRLRQIEQGAPEPRGRQP